MAMAAEDEAVAKAAEDEAVAKAQRNALVELLFSDGMQDLSNIVRAFDIKNGDLLGLETRFIDSGRKPPAAFTDFVAQCRQLVIAALVPSITYIATEGQ